MWCRAVWKESNNEEELVIPRSWVRDNQVYWPRVADAKKYLDEKKAPKESWQKFDLVKLKITSENREECENYTITTTAETSSEEEEDLSNRKRQKKKKTFRDCIESFHDSEDEPTETTRLVSKQKSDDLPLPAPPLKLSESRDGKLYICQDNVDQPGMAQESTVYSSSIYSPNTRSSRTPVKTPPPQHHNRRPSEAIPDSPIYSPNTRSSRTPVKTPPPQHHNSRPSEAIPDSPIYSLNTRSSRTLVKTPPPQHHNSRTSKAIRDSPIYSPNTRSSRTPVKTAPPQHHNSRPSEAIRDSPIYSPNTRSSRTPVKTAPPQHHNSRPSEATRDSPIYSPNTRSSRTPVKTALSQHHNSRPSEATLDSPIYSQNTRSSRTPVETAPSQHHNSRPSEATRDSHVYSQNTRSSRTPVKTAPRQHHSSRPSQAIRDSPIYSPNTRSSRTPVKTAQPQNNRKRTSYVTSEYSPIHSPAKRMRTRSSSRTPVKTATRFNKSPPDAAFCSFSRSRSPHPVTARSFRNLDMYYEEQRNSSTSRSHSPHPVTTQSLRNLEGQRNTSARGAVSGSSKPRTCSSQQGASTSKRVDVSGSKRGSKDKRDHTNADSRRSCSPSPRDLYPMSDAKFQRRVLFLLSDIKLLISDMGRHYEPPESSFHITTLETKEDFWENEENLNDKSERELLISRLSRIGGSTVKDCVGTIMQRLMTNSLMQAFNFEGRSYQNGKEIPKLAFGKTNLYKVIIDSVMKSQTTTEDSIKKEVKSKIKWAAYRKGGEKARGRKT